VKIILISLLVKRIQLVITISLAKSVIKLVELVGFICLRFTFLHKFALIIQEVVVFRELRPSCQAEDEVLVLSILLGNDVEFDKQVLEFAFKQVVPFDLSAHVLAVLFIDKDEFLNSVLLLIIVNFLHLLAMKSLLELFNSASENILVAAGLKFLVGVRIFPGQFVKRDLLLVDDPP